MSSSAAGVAYDNPEAYIAGDRRRALAAGVELPDRVHGAVLFADISGFTQLTEALVHEWGPQRGAEELSAVLDRVFDALLVHLHERDGSVVYFSGDAVTCWLDADDGRRSVACASAMQLTMTEVGRIALPSGTSIRLAMKVAIAVGPARRFVVGDPSVQLIDVLAGALMDQVATGERQAGPGQVLLDEPAARALGGNVSWQPSGSGSGFVLVTGQAAPPPPDPPDRVAELPEATVRQWLLPAVYERLRTGRGEFLAELRPAVPLFLSFDGIDYDGDDRAIERLDAFVVAAQRVVDGYGGSLLQLTIGDKGAYLYAVFGSPIAHENDAARACAAALDLLALSSRHPVEHLRIGLASGRLRSGTYGHSLRRTFCCLGDAVNLAARLMGSAAPGEIRATAEIGAAAGPGFGWTELAPLHLRGKELPVAAAQLRGRERPTTASRRRQLPLVGRDEAVRALTDHVDAALDGHGRVVAVRGVAGVGKSRLLSAVVDRLDRVGVEPFVGEAVAFGAQTSYAAWQGVWATALRVPLAGDPAERQHRLAATIGRLAPEVLPRLPLLGAVLEFPIPENELTASLTPQLRKASFEQLCVRLLEAVAAHRPVAIVLDDAQWLDPLSVDLLTEVARAIERLPVLVLLAGRTEDDHDPLTAVRELPHVLDLAVGPLDDTAAAAIVAGTAADLGAAPPGAELTARLCARAEGNPYFLEQLTAVVVERGVDDPGSGEEAALPDSLHSLVLSRVDTLPEGPRRTIKVASVVGRRFGADIVRGTYPELGGPDDVAGHLADLCTATLLVAETPTDRPLADRISTHAFRHVITAQVAYEATPAALRRVLHEQVAGYIERLAVESAPVGPGPGVSTADLDLLAHHYGRSDNTGKQREYLRLAGDRARGVYANAAAVAHYRRLVPLLEGTARVPVLIDLGSVLELTGHWSEAERTYAEAERVAVEAADADGTDRARVARAEVARKQGRYDEAAGLLSVVRSAAEQRADTALVAEICKLSGTLAAQQGDLDLAEIRYSEGLALHRELDDAAGTAAVLSNLAVVAEYGGDYTRAQQLNEEALQLRTEVGDRWAIGVSQNNLGMIALLLGHPAEAVERFTDAMRLNTEVGDAWMVAIAHHNLGNAYRELGDVDTAGDHLGAALGAYRRYADRWALAVAYDDVAALAGRRGDHEVALALVAAGDVVRADLGSPRPPAEQDNLDRRLATSFSALGSRVDEIRSRAQGLTPDDLASLADQVCLPTLPAS